MAEEKGGAKGSDPGKEIEKYSQILSRDPKSRAFAPLAEAYRKAGMLDDAIEIAREGLRHHPGYLGGSVALGRALFEKNEYTSAKAEFLQVIQAAPDNLMAHRLLGQIHLCLKDRTAAEKSFRMVLLLDPRDEEAQKYLKEAAAPPPPSPADVFPPPIESALPEVVPEPAAEDAMQSFLEPEVPTAGEDAPPDIDFGEVGEEWLAGAGTPPGEEGEEGPPASGDWTEGDVSGESVFDLAEMETRDRAETAAGEAEAEESEASLEVFTREPPPPPPEEVPEEVPEEIEETDSVERMLEVEDFTPPLLDLSQEDLDEEPLPDLPDLSEEEASPVADTFPPESVTELDEATLPDLPVEEEAPVTDFIPPEAVTELDTEIPSVDLADGFEELPAGDGGKEDIFGTATLADLYVSQGFYTKAAEVYRRLLRDRPGENSLRQKLEEVLALEKMESAGTEEPGVVEAPEAAWPAEAAPAFAEDGAAEPPPAPASPEAPESDGGSETVIEELRRLLGRLKERP